MSRYNHLINCSSNETAPDNNENTNKHLNKMKMMSPMKTMNISNEEENMKDCTSENQLLLHTTNKFGNKKLEVNYAR